MQPLSLVEVFADLPDPRSRHGKRYPLVAVLSLLTLGLLLGYKSVQACCEIPKNYGKEILLALGFPHLRCPSPCTILRLIAALDVEALEAALARWVASRLPPQDGQPVSLDGKALRGSRDGDIPGQHLVALYAPDAQAVLMQLRVDAKTNEHKAALQLLGILPVKGKVVVGDAAFCQRDLAQKITDDGGDYIFTVKGNQRGLEVDIGAGFAFEVAARTMAAIFSPHGTADRPQPPSEHGG